MLPFPAALAVADSARRAGSASALAANPFESVLRAIALDVPGLTPMPQVVIRDGTLVCIPEPVAAVSATDQGEDSPAEVLP